MRLFKRDNPGQDGTKCAECGERMPDGALTCSMCGHELAATQTAAQAPGGEERELGRRWA